MAWYRTGGVGSGTATNQTLSSLSWDKETHNVQTYRTITIDEDKLDSTISSQTYSVGILSMPVTVSADTVGLMVIYDIVGVSYYSGQYYPTIFCSDTQMTGVTDRESTYGYKALKQADLSSGDEMRNLVEVIPVPSQSFYFNIQFGTTNFENIRLYAVVEYPPDLIPKNILANGFYSAGSDNVEGYSSVNVGVPIVTNFTNVVTQGVLSADSQYKSATFDVDISNYKYILIKTYEQGATISTKNCTWIALDGTFPKYLSLCFVAEYNRYLDATLTSTSLTTTYYSGSWSTIYVDIVGTTADIFDDTSYITDLIPTPATSATTNIISNGYGADQPEWHAFDKDESTFWASNNGYQSEKYIGWKFDSPVVVNRVTMTNRDDADWAVKQSPKTWWVEGSNDDGTTWDTICGKVYTGWSYASETYTHDFINTVAYKWWRVRIVNMINSGDYCCLSELDFYHVERSNALATKTITANGTYNAIDDGVDGYSSVDVNVTVAPSPELPAEYQQVEYLDYQGGYFTVTIPSMAIYECQFDISDGNCRSDRSIGAFGYRVSGNNNNDWYINITYDLSSAELWTRSTNKSALIDVKNLSLNTKYTIWCDITVVRTTAYIGIYNPYDAGTTKNSKYEMHGKIYKLTGYTIDPSGPYMLIPLCDFIPCYRKSDNQVGVYDVVAGTFYTPTFITISGVKGTITAGPDVN